MQTSVEKFDLTDSSHYQMVREQADAILAANDLELLQFGGISKTLLYKMAVFLAKSKKFVLQKYSDNKYKVAVVMNLVHEHNRLRPASQDNPNGENSLAEKVRQIEWLTKDTHLQIDLIYVSGQDQWQSDAVLKQQLTTIDTSVNVQLVYVTAFAPEYKLRNWKGGEMCFAAKSLAGADGYPDLGNYDSVTFTDADMSVDLSQLGNALKVLDSGGDIVSGDRRNDYSILQKNLQRAGAGMYMYRHVQRRLAYGIFERLNTIDTQCPWKTFAINALKQIVPHLDTYTYAWDTDFLGAALQEGLNVQMIPISFIDSQFESHQFATGAGNRLYPLICDIYRHMGKYSLPSDDAVAGVFFKHVTNADKLEKMLASEMPSKYANMPESEFGKEGAVDLGDLEQWLGAVCKV